MCWCPGPNAYTRRELGVEDSGVERAYRKTSTNLGSEHTIVMVVGV